MTGIWLGLNVLSHGDTEDQGVHVFTFLPEAFSKASTMFITEYPSPVPRL